MENQPHIVTTDYTKKPVTKETITDYIHNIEGWAQSLGITKNPLPKQVLKLGEEFGELSKAVLDEDDLEIKDAIGDMVVVLTSVAKIAGTTLEECLRLTWEEISSRQSIKDSEGNVVATFTPGKAKNTERDLCSELNDDVACDYLDDEYAHEQWVTAKREMDTTKEDLDGCEEFPNGRGMTDI